VRGASYLGQRPSNGQGRKRARSLATATRSTDFTIPVIFSFADYFTLPSFTFTDYFANTSQ
jgi:hypothetical protein